MLVLSRQRQQQIVIGDAKIAITILDIQGGRVRLGITAPSEVTIRRSEVVEIPEPRRAEPVLLDR